MRTMYDGNAHPSGKTGTIKGNSTNTPFISIHDDIPNIITSVYTITDTSFKLSFNPILIEKRSLNQFRYLKIISVFPHQF